MNSRLVCIICCLFAPPVFGQDDRDEVRYEAPVFKEVRNEPPVTSRPFSPEEKEMSLPSPSPSSPATEEMSLPSTISPSGGAQVETIEPSFPPQVGDEEEMKVEDKEGFKEAELEDKEAWKQVHHHHHHYDRVFWSLREATPTIWALVAGVLGTVIGLCFVCTAVHTKCFCGRGTGCRCVLGATESPLSPPLPEPPVEIEMVQVNGHVNEQWMIM